MGMATRVCVDNYEAYPGIKLSTEAVGSLK